MSAFYVHNVLGPGHLEHVPQNALVIVLRREGLQVRDGVNVPVDFEGFDVGRCEADLIVEHVVVVENKATLGIRPGHETRLGAYLNCSG
ncbi:MAG: GxxExxY protein [Planctomycetota bacterium]